MEHWILSLLISHILKEFDSKLKEDEPAIVNIAVKEIELFISKLENLLASKHPNIAAAVNPILVDVGAAAVAGVEAVGNSLVNNQ